MEVTIRIGVKQDIPQVLTLIKELAKYEREEHEVETTIEQMGKDGFGKNKIFDFFVAENKSNKIIGVALFYFKYSTWKGKCLFLEDIIVKEEFRRQKIGAKLFQQVINLAKQKHLKRMEWQVLDWNEPAINFYKKYNSELDPQWLNGELNYQKLQAFV